MDTANENWRSKSYPKAGEGVNRTGPPETRGRDVVNNAIATTENHIQGMRDVQQAQGGFVANPQHSHISSQAHGHNSRLIAKVRIPT